MGMCFCVQLFRRPKQTTHEPPKVLAVKSAGGIDPEFDQEGLNRLMTQYVVGDEDDHNATLIQAYSSERDHASYDEVDRASNTPSPDLPTRISLSLPRSLWVEKVLQQNNPPLSARSSSPTNTLDPLSRRPSSSSPHSGSDPIEVGTPAGQSTDHLWISVTRDLIKFPLGVHPDHPHKTVGVGAMYEIKLDRAEGFNCYKDVFMQSFDWAVRMQETPKEKRISVSARVPLNPSSSNGNEAAPSPKMYLKQGEDDTEIRTFISNAPCGVPLISLTLLRCKENSIHTHARTATGLIIVHIGVAENIPRPSEEYKRWIIKDLVVSLIPYYDCVRVATAFWKNSAENLRVVNELVAENVLTCYKDRYIRHRRILQNTPVNS